MGTGRKKIEVKKVERESQRTVTFSKRRKGLFKKANELHSITGSNIAVLVFSPAGRPYIHGDPCFGPTIDHYLRTVQEIDKIDDEDCEIKNWSSWVNSIRVEKYDDVDELVFLKNTLEKIKEKIVYKIDDEFARSCLV